MNHIRPFYRLLLLCCVCFLSSALLGQAPNQTFSAQQVAECQSIQDFASLQKATALDYVYLLKMYDPEKEARRNLYMSVVKKNDDEQQHSDQEKSLRGKVIYVDYCAKQNREIRRSIARLDLLRADYAHQGVDFVSLPLSDPFQPTQHVLISKFGHLVLSDAPSPESEEIRDLIDKLLAQ